MTTPPDPDAILFRTAIAAFTYHPSRHLDEPGYDLDDEIDWCLEPAGNETGDDHRELREQLRELITNPNADRRAFIRKLRADS